MNLMPRVWIPRTRSYDVSGIRVCTLKMLQRPCKESPHHVFVQSQGINRSVRTAASGRENKKGSQRVSQCVLACDQLLFQSKLNWGQVILSRAPSPRGAAVVFELRRLSEAPVKRFVAPPRDRIGIRSNLTVSPQSWRCWNRPTPPSWCTISTVCTGNPGRWSCTKAPRAWASTSWAAKTARASLSPSS